MATQTDPCVGSFLSPEYAASESGAQAHAASSFT